MGRLKVIDFDYGCGGFTKGLEDSGVFEVIYNGAINNKNSYCYNKTHINDFDFFDLMPDDYDLAVFTPDLGHKLFGVGKKNFYTPHLDNYTALITLKDIENLIFITQRETIPLLQKYGKVLLTSDNMPTMDLISCRLLDLGYNVYNFVLDGAGFGMAQHKYYNIYWASKTIDKSIEINEGFGRYKRKYRVVKNVIGDIDDSSDLSWHNPNYKKRDICSMIQPGSNAYKTKELSQTSGYVRLSPNKMASSLLYNFYIPSSKSSSINPWYDRPLTIREGARLFGLTDDFDWDIHLSKGDVSMMIYESFYPIISKLMAYKIKKLLKNR